MNPGDTFIYHGEPLARHRGKKVRIDRQLRDSHGVRVEGQFVVHTIENPDARFVAHSHELGGLSEKVEEAPQERQQALAASSGDRPHGRLTRCSCIIDWFLEGDQIHWKIEYVDEECPKHGKRATNG